MDSTATSAAAPALTMGPSAACCACAVGPPMGKGRYWKENDENGEGGARQHACLLVERMHKHAYCTTCPVCVPPACMPLALPGCQPNQAFTWLERCN